MHFVAAVAVSALLLTGCNPGGDPNSGGTSSGAPTASSTASPSPTPTATPVYVPASASGRAQNVPVPVLPEVAKKETKEGLEAFVSYWYSTLSYAYETGDTKPLESVSGPGCVFCSGLREGVAEAWNEGRWVSGGTIETPSVEARFTSGAPSLATIQVLQKQTEIRNADGSLYQAPSLATNAASQATAAFNDGRWLLTDLGLIR
ncbi:UNVERIFIED_ORG: hypothetical protein ABIB13_001511 [Arthrobacter sp. UYEF2]